MFGRKALAIATASVFGLGLLSSAAVAALAPVSTGVLADQGTAASVDAKGPKPGAPDKFKAILDALVAKGVITQAQEDAILAALKDAAGQKDRDDVLERILRVLFEQSATYLGIAPADLKAKLPGTSLGAIAANATPGKSRDGLVAALTTASTTAIDKAFGQEAHAGAGRQGEGRAQQAHHRIRRPRVHEGRAQACRAEGRDVHRRRGERRARLPRRPRDRPGDRTTFGQEPRRDRRQHPWKESSGPHQRDDRGSEREDQ